MAHLLIMILSELVLPLLYSTDAVHC